jgi:hypothetical protein
VASSFAGTIPLLATPLYNDYIGRLVFASTYRRLTEAMDAETLRDFAKRWTSDILVANEPATTGVR